MKIRLVVVALVAACSIVVMSQAAQMPTDTSYTNSIGMKFIRIRPGSFTMGFEGRQLPESLLTKKGHRPNGDFDEKPSHKVTISKAFYMGAFEVTNAQYEQFDPTHKMLRGRNGYSRADDEAVVFVSWFDAMAFCKWLSEKEGLPYRLASEAEWEYACRVGTNKAFYTGDTLPEEFSKGPDDPLTVGMTKPNAWGLYDMHGNVEEWCLDWYGQYAGGDQTDPVGPVDGDFRIVRSGSHSTEPYYLRSANRLGTVPEDNHWMLGFRVIIGEMPATKSLARAQAPLNQRNVSQDLPLLIDPYPGKPYFKGPRQVVKIPEGMQGPIYAEHNHFMAVTECPNGDLLAAWFTCEEEMGRELAVAASRLRYGTDEWDPASVFWDAPDRNDHANALWYNGKGTLFHFNGLSTRWRQLAVIMRTSNDNGATWSRARLIFPDHAEGRNTVVESIFRASDGSIVVPFDGRGGSIIRISSDEGRTWSDPGGSVRGTHGAVTQLSDGTLMGFGRHGEIDGRMPKSISLDMGRTWNYVPGPFTPIHSGRRVALMKLSQGPIFAASFCHDMLITDASGKTRPVTGLFASVSLDEGKTWPYRRLLSDDGPGREIGTMDGDPIIMDASNAEPVGYLGVCQSADGIVHLLSSRNHYAFNLTWLTTRPPAAPPAPAAPEAKRLTARSQLLNVYSPTGLPTEHDWKWNFNGRGFTESDVVTVDNGHLNVHTDQGRQFWLRSEKVGGFADVDPKSGFTAEIRTRIDKRMPGNRGVDLELYDGAGSRYAMTITDKGLYWYRGTVQGSAMLPFGQYKKLVGGLDNTDAMHTYRIAVRPDRVAQIYRDGKLMGLEKYIYRTPRYGYIYIGAGPNVQACIDHVGYDLSGSYKP